MFKNLFKNYAVKNQSISLSKVYNFKTKNQNKIAHYSAHNIQKALYLYFVLFKMKSSLKFTVLHVFLVWLPQSTDTYKYIYSNIELSSNLQWATRNVFLDKVGVSYFKKN